MVLQNNPLEEEESDDSFSGEQVSDADASSVNLEVAEEME